MSAHGGDGRACPKPIDTAELMDYWLAALPAAHEEAVEEHLMACDVCGDTLRAMIALAEGLRTVARSGSLHVVIGQPFVDRAAAAGLRVRDYAPPPGGSVYCTVSADDDLLVARLAADLTGVPRVDLSWCDLRGVEHRRMVDIPVLAGGGGVIVQQSITWAKASPTATMVARLLAVDGTGAERLIGEYTFHHERTIPGAPGWELP